MAAELGLLLTTTKTCTQCHRELPVEHFHRNRSRRDGYQHYCKKCKFEWYQAHAESIAQRGSDYRKANAKHIRVQKAEWYKLHKQEIANSKSVRYKLNTDRICQYQVIHHKTIPGYVARVWYNLNKRTIDGSHPRWTCPHHRRYLLSGVQLLITREELKALVVQHWDEIQAIWDSGEPVHIHRIGPSIHYSADNIEFLSQSEHRARHSRPKYEDID